VVARPGSRGEVAIGWLVKTDCDVAVLEWLALADRVLLGSIGVIRGSWCTLVVNVSSGGTVKVRLGEIGCARGQLERAGLLFDLRAGIL
jgi:hypothetical protein